MKKLVSGTALIIGIVLLGFGLTRRLSRVQRENQTAAIPAPTAQTLKKQTVNLPQPELRGEISLEEAILKRRSRRDYQDFKPSPGSQAFVRDADWVSKLIKSLTCNFEKKVYNKVV